ncbi:MAG: hypothetical protein EOO88_12305 [Pedobacter sp.]|nr:MAG: hypothetical protein EOO88_12305 [Pedobacter sp.]
MGIKLLWQEAVLNAFEAFGARLSDDDSGKYTLLSFAGKDLVINLVSLNNDYEPGELIRLQDYYRQEGVKLIQLWEDIWAARNAQVIGRVKSLLGLNKRIHARKTKITAISQAQAAAFLEGNHIQSSASSKHRFALLANDEIVAVACFSGLMLMKHNKPIGYRSAEVIRFASLSGFTVTGGFTKLLKHFIAQLAPDDIMSYADRDWSDGRVYEQAGFKQVAITLPSEIHVHPLSLIRYFPHRLPGQSGLISTDAGNCDFLKVFNTGNLKYIYYL